MYLVTAGKSVVTAPLGSGAGRPPYLYVFLQKKRNYTKNAGPVALAAMEECSGAYMRLLHNVFRVN